MNNREKRVQAPEIQKPDRAPISTVLPAAQLKYGEPLARS
jgi:hypothetical protein